MQDVFETRVTIKLPEGLHLRPADAFVSLAKTFEAKIELSKDAEFVDGKSILSIITLAAAEGEQLLIRAQGDDASGAIEVLAALVERNFDLVKDADRDETTRPAGSSESDVQTTEENV